MTTATNAGTAGIAAPRHQDLDALLQQVRSAPYRFDLWQLLRTIDALQPADVLPLGRAPTPRQEPIRIGQAASLAFAPAQVDSCEPGGPGGRPQLSILGFGLFGPNGPLPIHLTEYARERERSGDPTFVRFCNLIHHRFTLLFYRAWADVQPTASLDRPGHDHFTRFVASLVHLGDPTLRDRDAVPDHAKLFGAGHLVRDTRNAEGLQRLLEAFFGAAVRIEPWIFHWQPLAPEQRTRLGSGRDAEQLGIGSVVGQAVPDAQGKFRIRLGPLALADYERHLPGGRPFFQLLAWVRNYVGCELGWDVRLLLRRAEVPKAQLGGSQRLGWTTWVGTRIAATDADDLLLEHERWAGRLGAN